MRRRPTPAEAALWQRLRGSRLGVRARRQCVLLGWIVDFYVPAVALVVEVDGDIHDLSQDDDARRTEVLEQAGLLVLRFHNAEVLDAPQRVLTVIRAVIASR
ncbi:MAG: endonuclease domain-containing protein [Polyangiales bacterium]